MKIVFKIKIYFYRLQSWRIFLWNWYILSRELEAWTATLQQQKLDVLNEVLYSVSDSQSSKYGKHWSYQEVAALVSNPMATESVRNYLIDNGIYIEKVSKYGDYIRASATIGQWETLFQTKFYEFHDEMHGITFPRSLEYSLPDFIYDQVIGVLGVVDYFPPTNVNTHAPAKVPTI